MFRCGLVSLFLLVSYPVGGVSHTCVSNCEGRADGDYTSCTGCGFYASCAGGQLYDRECAASLVWDDVKKNCDYESSTCTTGTACVSNCTNQADGFYQACDSCRTYTFCTGDTLSTRQCPIALVWDDNNKACQLGSSTCGGVPVQCINNCVGISNGLYQACDTCNDYAVCVFGGFLQLHCPPFLTWDDDRKLCRYRSPTCYIIPS